MYHYDCIPHLSKYDTGNRITSRPKIVKTSNTHTYVQSRESHAPPMHKPKPCMPANANAMHARTCMATPSHVHAEQGHTDIQFLSTGGHSAKSLTTQGRWIS